MKNNNCININWNPVKKRPYPYINDEGNNIILKKIISKNLIINSKQYNIDENLIKKFDTMDLNLYVNKQINILNKSISINKDINNNSFSTINKIEDDQEDLKIICDEHDIINMINLESNDNIILHKKNNHKKNKKIPLDKNKDNAEKIEFNKENFENNNISNNNNNNPENPNDNNNVNNNQINNINYINQQLYPIVINRLNINPSNLRIFNPLGNGNCLFRLYISFHIRL